MTERWLTAVLRWSRRGLLLLFLVGTARLLYVAWSGRASGASAATSVGASERGSVRASTELMELYEAITRGQPVGPSAELVPRGATVAPSAVATASRPRTTHVYLVVNVTPDRAEVLVNGVARGQTPYVGEVDCQSGSTMTVAVLARKGAPKIFERLCDRSEIRIEESRDIR